MGGLRVVFLIFDKGRVENFIAIGWCRVIDLGQRKETDENTDV